MNKEKKRVFKVLNLRKFNSRMKKNQARSKNKLEMSKVF